MADTTQPIPSEVEWVKTRRNASWSASKLDFQRFATYYNLARNRQTKKNYLGLANLFIPEPYKIVHKKTAKLSNAIRKIEVTPESQNDIEGAKAATHLLNFLRRKLDWHLIERSGIQESRVVGLAWWKLLWNVSKEEKSKPYMGFDLTFHSADEILLPPNCTMLDFLSGNCEYLIHEYEADISELQKNPNYDATALTTLKLRSGTGKSDTSSLEQSRLMYAQKAEVANKKTKFKIWEYWGAYNDKSSLIVIADSTIKLRSSTNPYEDILNIPIPFVPVLGNVVGKEFYPIGDIEPGESLFNELNDTRNQRMDTVTLNIDPMKVVTKGANIKDEDLIAKRGWIVRSSLPGSQAVQVIPPDMQGVKAAIEEEQAIRGDIQQYSGVIDFAPGSEVQAGISIDTARGTIIAKTEADVLVEDELVLLKMSLRSLYRIALAYAQKFLDGQFVMRLIENGAESFSNYDNSAIQGNYDLDIEMKTLQDITTQQQLAILLFNQAKTIPGANIGKFFTDLLSTFKENINIDEYYQSPQSQPEPPKVSISLKGDLNPAEVDEIYKMTGADPTAADPLFRQEFRQAMRGVLPEHQMPQEIAATSTSQPTGMSQTA